MGAAVVEQLVEQTEALTPAERTARLHEVEARLRRLEVEAAVLVRAIEQDRSYKADGHLSLAGFLRGEFRWSPTQVTERKRLARLVDALPSVIEHLHDGAIGVAQAHAFGRAAANPRCGDLLGEHADTLLGFARVLPYEHFLTAIQRWERLADGAHRDAEASHANRSAHLTLFDGIGRLQAQCGALDHAQFAEIFERYQHAEFLTDWQSATAQHGNDAAGSMLPRTNAQRSWDALMRMALDAVSTPPGVQAPEPVVNIVCSVTHLEEQLSRSGLIPDPEQTAEPPLSPMPFEQWRCETTNGVPLTPNDVMQAMIHGRVRRVVFGSDGVVLDYGRLRRLFDGAARQAVMLQSQTCIFPGCNRPASWCQADHLTDWQHGGTTSQTNSGPTCERHNLLKNLGFTVWRDPNGVFHTYRPDGTEIAEPPAPPGTAPPPLPTAA